MLSTARLPLALLLIAGAAGAAPWSVTSESGEVPIAHIEVDPSHAFTLDGAAGSLLPVEPGGAPLAALPFATYQAGATPEGDAPGGMAFTPDGSQIVIAHWETKNLIVWDAATGAFVRSIALSGSPLGVAISSGGQWAITPNGFEDTASIVDLATGAEVAVVPVGDQPGVVAISPDGTTAAVGNTVEGSVSVIDLASATELRRVPGVGFVAGISVNFESGSLAVRFSQFVFAGNGKLLSPDYYNDRVQIIDVATGAVTNVATPDAPKGVAVTPDGATAVIANTGAESMSVLDVASATITNTYPIGADVYDGAIAINPSGTKAVIAILNACKVVTLATGALSPSLGTATVNELYTTADGQYAFCVGYNGSLISYATEAVVKNLNFLVSLSNGAVSPVDARAAGVANSFGEDLLIMSTNGPLGALEHHSMSGPEPEGDKARQLAISPDGSKIAMTQILSDNAAVHDAATGALLYSVDAGDRPSEVAFSPDGATAVVANLDASFASVIDVATGLETEVGISARGSQVEISPDGIYAYVAVVTNDGVWRIHLPTRTATDPKLTTSNMGGIGFYYNQTSGMTLSHDGATLVVCGSFSNQITLIDTATWTVTTNVTVTGFPVYAIFSADDSRIYVSSRDNDAVYAVSNAGVGSTIVQTYATGDGPFHLALSPDGGKLYVENFTAKTIRVINTATSGALATIVLPDTPGGIALSADGSELYAGSGNWSVTMGPGPYFSRASTGQFSVINTSTYAIGDQVITGVPTAMLAYSAAAASCAVPSTIIDGYYTVGVTDPAAVGGVGFGRPALLVKPTPAWNSCTLSFVSKAALPLHVDLFDAAGRRVRALDGPGPMEWDLRDDAGQRVPAGVYLVRAASGDDVVVGRVVVR